MFELKTVMVPIDFSDASREAVRYGVSLAVECDAGLVLAHVVPFLAPVAYAYPFESGENKPGIVEEIHEKMAAFIPPDLANAVKHRFAVSSGDVRDELLAMAAVHTPDVIVMGTHGRRLFERWLLGSVTDHLLRHSPIPLLTVSRLDAEHDISEPQPIPLNRILYATDLAEGSERALGMAHSLAHRFSADLKVVHVMSTPHPTFGIEAVPLESAGGPASVRESLVAQLEASVPENIKADPRVDTELLEGVPYEQILRTAEDGHYDLIVLNTRRRGALERALLGSTAERVVRGAPIPVLSVPPEGAAFQVRTESGGGGVLI